MTISGQFADYIRQMYAEGATQEEIAKKINLPQSSVARVLSGKKDISLMTISTLEKAFPGAVLDLSGCAASSVPEMEDPQLFAMVVDCWQKITTEDRGAIVGQILAMAKTSEKNTIKNRLKITF